jgi:hypothetical protein
LTNYKVLLTGTLILFTFTSLQIWPLVDVNTESEEVIQLSTYLSRNNSKPKADQLRFRFKIGDYVHITFLENVFIREYDEK